MPPNLNPNDLRCYFCNKPIEPDDALVLFIAPNDRPAVTHLHHHGVRKYLLVDMTQITNGATLMGVALNFVTFELDEPINYIYKTIDIS